jgi:hypothetical protein
MIPAYIRVFILRPGELMDASKRPADEPRPNEITMIGDHEHDGFAMVESDGRAIYSVERGIRLKDEWKGKARVTALEQIQIDLFGRLAETLLCIESVTELPDAALLHADGSDPFWLHSTLSECGWDLLSDADLQAIHEDAAKLIAHEAAQALERAGRAPDEMRARIDAQTNITVSWPCFFTVETSRDWETSHTDIEAINYAGAATLVNADIAGQLAAAEIAHKAVAHTLGAICDDPRKFYLMGPLTGSRETLLKAWAAKHGKTEDEADEFWQVHDRERYKRHCSEIELCEQLLQAYRDGRIGMPEHEARAVGFSEEAAARLAAVHEKRR